MIFTEERLVSKEEAQSSQIARALDIFFIGPLLIYVGLSGKVGKTISTILIIIAVSTILYNVYYLVKYSKENNNP